MPGFSRWKPHPPKRTRPKRNTKITYKIKHSTLDKAWNRFIYFEKSAAILRGSFSQIHKRFLPRSNGFQGAANSIVAIICSGIRNISSWTSTTINNILEVGDKLFLMSVMHKPDKRYTMTVRDLQKSFYIGNNVKVTFTIEGDDVVGPVFGDPESVLVLIKGLKNFFQNYKYGICFVNQMQVAIWKKNGRYFLFDPNERNRNGLDKRCVTSKGGLDDSEGVACCICFDNLTRMAELLSTNFSIIKDPNYMITPVKLMHKATIVLNPPASLPEPKRELPKIIKIRPPVEIPTVKAFDKVISGKSIILADMSQNNRRFDRENNVQCSTNALITLAMTKIHKTELWTKEILDEILILGDRFYGECIQELGYTFNPWEQTLTLDKCKNVANIGINEVKFDILFDLAKKGKIMQPPEEVDLRKFNVKRGIEYFFVEYTHGVFYTEKWSFAMWLGERMLYIFDPYPNGCTGYHLQRGVACLLSFINVHLLVDHILLNIDIDDREADFQIIPVDITLVDTSLKKKKFGTSKTDLAAKSSKDFAVPSDIRRKGCDGEQKDLPSSSHSTKSKKVTKRQRRRELRRKRLLEKIVLNDGISKVPTGFTVMDDGSAVLVGSFSITSRLFSSMSRGLQAIPCAVISIVMFYLHEIKLWKTHTLDAILLSGDQLYKDSYLFFQPESENITLSSTLRRFFMDNYQVSILIYKPGIEGMLRPADLAEGITDFFLQESAGILQARGVTMAIFQKGGLFYIFEPYDRDLHGNIVKIGRACVIRFDQTEHLAANFMSKIIERRKVGKFQISAVHMKNIKCISSLNKGP